MKTMCSFCSKHSSSIPQAMLGRCSMLCLMCARRCLCVLRTSDCVLRTPNFDLRFSISDLRVRLQSYLSVVSLLTASRSSNRDKRQVENPKPNPLKESLI
jgi:hypothetical protein